ncbi:MAG: hypothetical protein ACYC2K_18745 [Gemmatimonadales bacterium]
MRYRPDRRPQPPAETWAPLPGQLSNLARRALAVMPVLESITPAKLAHLASLPTEAGKLAQVIGELEAAGLIAATPERLLLLTALGRRRQRGAS